MAEFAACPWPTGRKRVQKDAERCHWCYEATAVKQTPPPPPPPRRTILPLPPPLPSLTPQSVVPLQPPSVASLSVVPLQPPKDAAAKDAARWAVPSLQPPSDAAAHRWAVPLKLHLAIDSTGKTKGSKSVDYTRHVVSELAAGNNISLTVTYVPGSDLPELTSAIKKKSHDSDAHVLISMSNYSMETINTVDVSPHIFEACRDLSQAPAPVKVIYGGPGELWEVVKVVKSGHAMVPTHSLASTSYRSCSHAASSAGSNCGPSAMSKLKQTKPIVIR